MTIDPRLVERRRAVAEDRAKHSIGRLLRILAFVLVVAAVVWAAFSPWMSVNQVRTAGVNLSDTNRILTDHKVIAGTAMVTLRPGQVEQALVADPWVREARVHLDWPDEVVVRVVERTPVAWFLTSGGWARRDSFGVAVPSVDSPDGSLPQARLGGVADAQAEESPFVLGTAEFVEALNPDLRSGLEIRVESGELWALASGYQVRLGRPVEMRAKALSLEAMLSVPIAPDSTLILVAPSHPAISPPSKDASPAAEDGGDGADSSEGGQP